MLGPVGTLEIGRVDFAGSVDPAVQTRGAISAPPVRKARFSCMMSCAQRTSNLSNRPSTGAVANTGALAYASRPCLQTLAVAILLGH
jgi:hypothetical protein